MSPYSSAKAVPLLKTRDREIRILTPETEAEAEDIDAIGSRSSEYSLLVAVWRRKLRLVL